MMGPTELLRAIDEAEQIAPGFLQQLICDTWLRRAGLPAQWFLRTAGGGSHTVAELRAAIVSEFGDE